MPNVTLCEISHRLEIGTSASKDAEPRREVDCEIPRRLKRGTSVSEDADPEERWTVRSHIGWGGERNILYKGVETSP